MALRHPSLTRYLNFTSCKQERMDQWIVGKRKILQLLIGDILNGMRHSHFKRHMPRIWICEGFISTQPPSTCRHLSKHIFQAITVENPIKRKSNKGMKSFVPSALSVKTSSAAATSVAGSSSCAAATNVTGLSCYCCFGFNHFVNVNSRIYQQQDLLNSHDKIAHAE